MGGCCAVDSLRKARKQMEVLAVEFKEQRKLLSKILSWDFNIGKKPVLTIVKRFARENCNDIGDSLNITTANIIMVEFKKFIFLVALRIIYDKDKKY
jgi:hypothetical protein